jgi:hypothetical protein
MRKTLLILGVLLLPNLCGCSVGDLLQEGLFGAFGTYYSNGDTRENRYDDYSRTANSLRGTSP